MVVEVIFGVMDHGGIAVTNEDVGSGALFEHESKVFTAHNGGSIGGHVLGSGDFGGDCGGKLGLGGGVDHDGVALMVVDFGRGPVGLSGVFADGFDAFLGEGADVLFHGAHGAAELHAFGDDVVGFAFGAEGSHGNDEGLEGVGVARGDGLQRDYDLGGNDGGIDGFVRLGGMTAEAGHIDGEIVGGGEEGAFTNGELADGDPRHIVHTVDFLDTELVHHAVGAHFAAAAAAFFGGLVDDDGSAVEVAGFGEVFGRAE